MSILTMLMPQIQNLLKEHLHDVDAKFLVNEESGQIEMHITKNGENIMALAFDKNTPYPIEPIFSKMLNPDQ